ncbi:Hpt domain-containing protein [Desulfuromonas thiophila]|uniref:Hpt domain-containing protein n=1 Tax=Desulfuromonas thiophila TaxID=57664 RepID=UPI0029F545C5|nr:Hpt domain-containing protein [Desulfuromonas thiophila]
MTTDSALLEELAGLTGLDLARGLRTARQSPAKLLHYLACFAALHANEARQLRDLIAQAEPASALRLAHNLKGVALGLGLNHISSIAAELERQLRPPQPATLAETKPLLTELAQQLRQQCQAIRQLRERYPAAGPTCQPPAQPQAGEKPAAESMDERVTSILDR